MRAKSEPHRRLLGQRLVEVLEARGAAGAPPSRRSRPPSGRALNAALSTRNQGSTDGERDVEARRRRRRAWRRRGTSTPSRGHRRRAVAAQPEAVEPAGLARARGASPGTSHSVIGPSAASGPARPDVAVGLAGRGDPALLRVEAHAASAVARVAVLERRPEVAARAGLGERQRRQVARRRAIASRIAVGAVGLEQRRAAVVHQHDHRRRAAGAGQALDHLGGPAQARPAPPTSARSAAEQARVGQRLDPGPGEGAARGRPRRRRGRSSKQ